MGDRLSVVDIALDRLDQRSRIERPLDGVVLDAEVVHTHATSKSPARRLYGLGALRLVTVGTPLSARPFIAGTPQEEMALGVLTIVLVPVGGVVPRPPFWYVGLVENGSGLAGAIYIDAPRSKDTPHG